MSTVHRLAWAAALASGLALGGCGTPGAPMPPSLKLPDRVANLAALRAGNQVTLTWTMPKKNTDKLLLKEDVPVAVCRKQGEGACVAAGTELLAPGAEGTFSETLPEALASGAPRPLSYFVELRNRIGRSAGQSNAAEVLAGQAPAPLTGLAAEVRKDGIALRWTTLAAAQEPPATSIRLHRTLLTAPAAKPKQGLLAPVPEPLERSLLVEAGARAGRALDKEIRFGQSYEYRAQRVVRVALNGQTLELAGELSTPVRVEALDLFPPAVPTALAAVATAAENGQEAAIDLSWQPDTEADLAGYAVYRREDEAVWQRVSPAEPLAPPAFRDTRVLPGHTYRYAVTALDQGGHESARSAETQETVPNP